MSKTSFSLIMFIPGMSDLWSVGHFSLFKCSLTTMSIFKLQRDQNPKQVLMHVAQLTIFIYILAQLRLYQWSTCFF